MAQSVIEPYEVAGRNPPHAGSIGTLRTRSLPALDWAGLSLRWQRGADFHSIRATHLNPADLTYSRLMELNRHLFGLSQINLEPIPLDEESGMQGKLRLNCEGAEPVFRDATFGRTPRLRCVGGLRREMRPTNRPLTSIRAAIPTRNAR